MGAQAQSVRPNLEAMMAQAAAAQAQRNAQNNAANDEVKIMWMRRKLPTQKQTTKNKTDRAAENPSKRALRSVFDCINRK
mgnify:CR=1 FL=1